MTSSSAAVARACDVGRLRWLGVAVLVALAGAPSIAAAEPAPVDVPLFAPTSAQEPKAAKKPRAKQPKTEKPEGEDAAAPAVVDPGTAPPQTAPSDGALQAKDVAENVGEPGVDAAAEPAQPGEDGATPEAAEPAQPGEDGATPEAGDPVNGAFPEPEEGLAPDAPVGLAGPPASSAAGGADLDPPSEANDSPVTVTTKIDPDPSFVGDLLTLEVTAAYPTGYRVNLPTGVDFSPLHLVEIVEGDPEPSGEGYFRKVFTVTLQHFEAGEAKVPSFPLTYVGAGGEVETVRVASRSFTVDSLLANEADPERQLEDPPIALEYPNTTAELVIYSAAVAMLAGFLLALFWRRFASRREEILGPPPVPAHEVALSALATLEESEFLETGLVQDYYLELTEIAKGYLEGRFGVDALDRTTEEIRRDLERHRDRIEPLKPDDVIRFLSGCDLVKFARFDPELDEARSALGEVRNMVEETKPREVVSAFAGEMGSTSPEAGDAAEGEPTAGDPAQSENAPDQDGAQAELAAVKPSETPTAQTAETPRAEPVETPTAKPAATPTPAPAREGAVPEAAPETTNSISEPAPGSVASPEGDRKV